MYTDDIINVPADDSPEFEPTTTLDPISTVSGSDQPTLHGRRFDDPDTSSDSSNRGAVIAAVIATVILFAVMGFVLVKGSDNSTAASPPLDLTSVAPSPTVPAAVPTPAVNPVPIAPVVPAPPAITTPPVDTAPPVVPEPVAPPVAPPVDTVPPVVPPSPAGELAVQTEYLLDPGVDAVSIVLSNQGNLDLTYEIVNDGEGFSADQPSASIAAGTSTNVWIALDLVSDGEGPTTFEQAVVVESNWGDAVTTISGQVEKPGFVIAEFESLPIVDYRATLRFTNVGGLPVDIVGLEAPGLRYAPIPAQIGAGVTFELDVAVCDGGVPLPVMVPTFHTFPTPPSYEIGTSVTLETVAGPDAEPQLNTTDLSGSVDEFEPLDCSPIVVSPVGEIAIAVGG